MGTFNVKNFFGSMFTPVEDEMEENYYGEEEGYIYSRLHNHIGNGEHCRLQARGNAEGKNLFDA